MVPPEENTDKEKKIASLEQQLNDLRQGLTVVTDYYTELAAVKKHQEAIAGIDSLARPLAEEDIEFEGIWKFHEERLVSDPSGTVTQDDMFNTFTAYCLAAGRAPVERDAFEFVLAMMENPHPVLDKGVWTGCNLKKPDHP